jgi:hypothetical protein
MHEEKLDCCPTEGCHCTCQSRFAAAKAEIGRLRETIQKAIMRLGAPTMGYSPAIEKRELMASNEEASRVLIAALEDKREHLNMDPITGEEY